MEVLILRVQDALEQWTYMEVLILRVQDALEQYTYTAVGEGREQEWKLCRTANTL